MGSVEAFVSTVALATERLRGALIDPVSQPTDLLNFIVPSSETAKALVGSAAASEQPATNGTTTLTQSPYIGLPLSQRPIAPGLVSGVYLTASSGLASGGPSSTAFDSKVGDGGAARSPGASQAPVRQRARVSAIARARRP